MARPDLTPEVLCSLDVSHLSSYVRQGLSVAVRILLCRMSISVSMQTGDQGVVSGCRCMLCDVPPPQDQREGECLLLSSGCA